MKRLMIIFLSLLLTDNLAVGYTYQKLPQRIQTVDTVVIDNPVFVDLIDVRQGYVMSIDKFDSLISKYDVLTDSIMDVNQCALYSYFLKWVYLVDSSDEEYNRFFNESVSRDSIVDLSVPDFSLIKEHIEKNYELWKLPKFKGRFKRIALTGEDYNYFMFYTICDGEITRPIAFQNPEETQYILFPIME